MFLFVDVPAGEHYCKKNDLSICSMSLLGALFINKSVIFVKDVVFAPNLLNITSTPLREKTRDRQGKTRQGLQGEGR